MIIISTPTLQSIIIDHSHIPKESQAYSEENGILFMETSAKTAANVNELFVAIGKYPLLFIFLFFFLPFFLRFFIFTHPLSIIPIEQTPHHPFSFFSNLLLAKKLPKPRPGSVQGGKPENVTLNNPPPANNNNGGSGGGGCCK